MAQNNSVFVFVQKISNDSPGRPNSRININHVVNLKSLCFTWKKIANFHGVSTSFWSPYFWNRAFCGIRCCKTSTCINCCRSRWFSCTSPMKLSAFTCPLPPLVLGNNISNYCETDGCWFSFISPFAMFTKSINDFIIFGVGYSHYSWFCLQKEYSIYSIFQCTWCWW